MKYEMELMIITEYKTAISHVKHAQFAHPKHIQKKTSWH